MPGRHRSEFRVRPVAIVAAAAVVVAATSAWAGSSLFAEERCGDGATRLAVAAAPEIAPAVRSVATTWAGSAEVDGKCVTVEVTARGSAEVAAAVAGQQGVGLIGLGAASGSVQIPQLWIPDSSLWRQRLQAAAPGFRPSDGASIATSPVVLAVPQPLASSVNPGGGALTWDALRALAKGTSAVRDDLLSRFPDAIDPDAIASSLGAAVLPEQAVVAYDAQSPPIPLTALHVTPAPPALDYPLLVMPGATPATSRAIAGLRTALATASFRNALAEQGLRGPDGVGGAGFPYPAASRPAEASAAVDLDAVDQTLSAWLALTQPGRILTAIDVSGSMLTKVPNAGNRTREQVTVEAATRGLELFDDSWALGLWTFSTNLDGDRDYREILPVGPLTATRDRAVRGLAGIRPKVGGDTGLYDTILAAYQEMLDTWDRGRLNTVVIMTDGDNDDDNGLTLQALLDELGKRKDPRRPVDIVVIGIGPDITQAPLRQITGVTGGGVFTAPDPADIGTIFLRALALHTQPK
jgi:Ca-activated chloride channel family protein